jgi:hypothetical protein
MPGPDVYISIDVEADGPVPVAYSMTSLGLCVAGTFDGSRYERRDPSVDTFYRELRPISDRWDPEALAVGGFSRETLLTEGADPAVAIPEAVSWIEQVSDGMKPVLVAYPLMFDAAYWHAYAVLYNDGVDPFGHATHLDMKTMYQTKARSLISRSTKHSMPRHLVESRFPHTHNALDDAMGQAELFSNLVAWEGAS